MGDFILYGKTLVFIFCLFLPSVFFEPLIKGRKNDIAFKRSMYLTVLWICLLLVLLFLVGLKLTIIVLAAGPLLAFSYCAVKKVF